MSSAYLFFIKNSRIFFIKRTLYRRQKGTAWTVKPDKPLSEQSYIDYSSNRIIAANRCQQKINNSANGKSGGARRIKRKTISD